MIDSPPPARDAPTVGAAESADGPTDVPASRRMRWRRSTWHRLLSAATSCCAATRLSLPMLLATDDSRLRAWADAVEPMPLALQWRLTVIAETLFADDPAVARHAATLRGQLEATAAYLDRGPLRADVTPDAVRNAAVERAGRIARHEGAGLADAPADSFTEP